MAAKENRDIIPTQFIKKDFDLSEKVDKEFLSRIQDVFGTEVYVIGLTLLINSEKGESKEIVSFNYRNDKEQKNNEVLVDLYEQDSFEKIKKIF